MPNWCENKIEIVKTDIIVDSMSVTAGQEFRINSASITHGA